MAQTDPNQPPDAPPPLPIEEESRRPNPIGVQDQIYNPATGEWEDFTVPVRGYDFDFENTIPGRGFGVTPISYDQGPRYYAGHEDSIFSSMPRDQLIFIQSEMIKAGLLDPKKLTEGFGYWGDASRDSMKKVMTNANINGQTWETALRAMVQGAASNPFLLSGGGGGSPDPGFVPQPYLAPDYEDLSTQVRNFASQRLGRDLTDSETSLLADTLSSAHRQAYEAEVAASRSLHGDRQSAKSGADQAAESFTQVDPAMQFQAKFDELYKNETDNITDRADSKTKTQLLMRSVLGVDRKMGG